MSGRLTADRTEALDRLGARCKSIEPGSSQLGIYFLLCMTILANHAPDVVHFLLDRTNEKLGFDDDHDAGDNGPRLVQQTILASDPNRPGNCVSACVASYFGIELEKVPHFIEEDPDATVDGSRPSVYWWALLVGFMAGRGLAPVDLVDEHHAEPGEVVFASGPSPRGVEHQVLYKDGQLWHDPHPSQDGLLQVTEVIAWRPARYDHSPSTAGDR